MINPKLLKAFLEVGELRSFRAAADRLNRSQSALSMQIRTLEEQLGVSLFDRDTRNVALTPEGEYLLEYVRRALAELDAGLSRLKSLRTQYRGRVRVACVPSVAGTRLPSVIARFQADYPSVQVEVLELLAKPVVEAVRRGAADVGIGPISSDVEGLTFQTLFVEPICAVFPDDDSLAQSQALALKDLRGLPIMTVGNNTMQRDRLDEAQLEAGVRLRITHKVAHAQTLLRMVSAGLGVAIVPWVAMEVPGYQHLRACPIVSPPMSRDVCILWRSGAVISGATKRFSDVLTETIPSPSNLGLVRNF